MPVPHLGRRPRNSSTGYIEAIHLADVSACHVACRADPGRADAAYPERVREASVVVPSYAGADRLPRLLAALSRQSVPTEVVVVLDGVVDDSPTVLAGWADRSDRMDLQVVALPENRGRPAALNAGFAAAQGRVLIRCDDDLEPLPTHVAHHVAHHAGEPVGVIGMCPDVFPPDNAYGRVYGRQADGRVQRHAYGLAPEQTWRLWSANVSVTREVFDQVGGYDEAFRHYGWEDIDWGYRLHRLGVPIRIFDDLDALHHNPPLSVADRAGKALASGASRRNFEAKHGIVTTPDAAPAGLWGHAVHTLARRLTDEQRVASVGGVVDRLIARAPHRVGEKLAALVVEAAGVASRAAG